MLGSIPQLNHHSDLLWSLINEVSRMGKAIWGQLRVWHLPGMDWNSESHPFDHFRSRSFDNLRLNACPCKIIRCRYEDFQALILRFGMKAYFWPRANQRKTTFGILLDQPLRANFHYEEPACKVTHFHPRYQVMPGSFMLRRDCWCLEFCHCTIMFIPS